MLYDLIVSNIAETSASNEWNTGYIVGALEGIRRGCATPPSPDTCIVQCGPVTLRLDNWRFREGFVLGQEDRHAQLVEQEVSRTTLTARDVLSYIAHRE